MAGKLLDEATIDRIFRAVRLIETYMAREGQKPPQTQPRLFAKITADNGAGSYNGTQVTWNGTAVTNGLSFGAGTIAVLHELNATVGIAVGTVVECWPCWVALGTAPSWIFINPPPPDSASWIDFEQTLDVVDPTKINIQAGHVRIYPNGVAQETAVAGVSAVSIAATLFAWVEIDVHVADVLGAPGTITVNPTVQTGNTWAGFVTDSSGVLTFRIRLGNSGAGGSWTREFDGEIEWPSTLYQPNIDTDYKHVNPQGVKMLEHKTAATVGDKLSLFFEGKELGVDVFAGGIRAMIEGDYVKWGGTDDDTAATYAFELALASHVLQLSLATLTLTVEKGLVQANAIGSSAASTGLTLVKKTVLSGQPTRDGATLTFPTEDIYVLEAATGTPYTMTLDEVRALDTASLGATLNFSANTFYAFGKSADSDDDIAVDDCT